MWLRRDSRHIAGAPRRKVARSLGIALGTALVAGSGIALGAGPAQATIDPAAHLLGRGNGTYYTGSAYVVRAAEAGQSPWYSFIVVNDSAVERSYRVDLVCNSTCFTTATIYVGLTPVSGPFITPSMAPGQSSAFTLRISAPAASPQLSDDYSVVLSTEDGSTVLDTGHAIYSVAAHGGTRPDDLYVSQGGQPAVGGDNFEVISSQALQPGMAATFSVTLTNNTSTARNVSLRADPYQGCVGYRLRVTNGLTDVTTGVLAGTYTVRLAARLSTTLSAEVRHTQIADPSCNVDGWFFHASAASFPTSDVFAAVPDGTGQ